MSSPFLQLRKVTFFHRKGRPVLEGLDLDLDRGETLVVVGPSGCGKSTLLRCIAGLERPQQGSVHLEGAILSDDATFVPPEKRAIGLVFQGLALFPHLTVHENVGFGLRRIEGRERKRRIIGELEGVGLAELAERYPHELSGGQQQRVAIARALILRPRLMLMDEPFSDLDPRTRSEVRNEVLRILAMHNTPAIIVTHDREDAFHVADRIAEMDQGRILRNEPAAVVKAIWSDHPFEA